LPDSPRSPLCLPTEISSLRHSHYTRFYSRSQDLARPAKCSIIQLMRNWRKKT
jgi:hypothetical protein